MTTTETSRILKAHEIRGLHSQVAFNFEDLRKRCDDHVANVKEQVRKLIEDAHRQAEQLRQTAYDEGFRAGRRAGMDQADSEIQRRADELAETKAAEKLDTLVPALEAAASGMAREQDERIAYWERTALQLSVAIAEKLIRCKLNQQPEIGVEMISHALKLASGSPSLRVTLHPEDAALLGDSSERVIEAMAACGAAKIVPSEEVSRGSCIIESEYGSVDATLETMLERIVQELLEETEGER